MSALKRRLEVMEKIIECVLDAADLTDADFVGKRVYHERKEARKVAAYLIHHYAPKLTIRRIGWRMNRGSHAITKMIVQANNHLMCNDEEFLSLLLSADQRYTQLMGEKAMLKY